MHSYLEIADEAYLVENVVYEVKQVANAVIRNHNESRVIKYIRSHYKVMKKEKDE